jgi:hypothetical protein
MEDFIELSEEKVVEPVEEKVTATKTVAKETVVENVKIEEVVNEEGQKIITGPKKPKPAKSSNIQQNDEKVLGSRAADRSFNKLITEEKPKKNNEKVAIWSNKNIRWTGIGTLAKGYNIVTEEASEKWLDKDGIRKATPEEVATYFGK